MQNLADRAMRAVGEELLGRAVTAACESPCQKSKRGVAILLLGDKETAIVTGYNQPPAGLPCTTACLESKRCAKSAVHAEMDALLKVDPIDLLGADVLHVKVVDGKPVPSGAPSCVDCSKHILHVRCAAVWLLHEDGLRRYPAEEFHRLSLRAQGLPVVA